MNTIKSLCVFIVLSAVGYGAYVTLVGRPPNDAPPESKGWENAPSVQLPEMSLGGTAPSFAAPGAAAPSTSTAPAYVPSAEYLPSGTSAAPPYAAPGAAAPTSAAPTSEPPSTGIAYLTPPNVIGSELAPPPADVRTQFASTYNKALGMLELGQLADAHAELSQWVENPQLSQAERQQLLDLLDQVAGVVIYSRQHLLEQPYVVQPGDSLEKIAEYFQVSWQLLAKINGIPNPQAIRPGDQLKVVKGPFRAVINLRDFELTMFLGARYAGRFRVGIGLDATTPEGDFAVQNKVANPSYSPAPGQTIAANDPNNPLGGHWIDLGNHIGIHGTNDPQSIGRAESRGCIRLRPPEIDDVYDILSVGSKVTIRR